MRSGACHGFQVASNLTFQTLRAGAGLRLEVDEIDEVRAHGRLMARWHPRPRSPFHGDLRLDDTRYFFRASDVGIYVIDAAKRWIGVPKAASPLRREIRMWGIPTTLVALSLGDVSLHAAAVEIDGAAIVLAGRGYHGKTTLAAALARAGHRFLTEDSVRCRPGPPATVFPGPAVIRLRPDVAARLKVPGTRLLQHDDERYYLGLDEHTRGTADPLPLRAILLLNEENTMPRLDSVSGDRALRDLWAVAFKLPTDEWRASIFGILASLASEVEVFDLRRPLTIDALPAVIALIEGLARSR